jgi:hypothetical protein
MEGLGVLPAVLLALRALHKKADDKFNADGVEQTLPSTIGVKQGNIRTSAVPFPRCWLPDGVAHSADNYATGSRHQAGPRAGQGDRAEAAR